MTHAMWKSPPRNFDNFLTHRLRITTPKGMFCNYFPYRKMRVYYKLQKSKLPDGRTKCKDLPKDGYLYYFIELFSEEP